jgi:hypothetical protein
MEVRRRLVIKEVECGVPRRLHEGQDAYIRETGMSDIYAL